MWSPYKHTLKSFPAHFQQGAMKMAHAPMHMVVLLVLGLLTVSNGAGWATVRSTITLSDSTSKNIAVILLEDAFVEAFRPDDRSVVNVMYEGDSDNQVKVTVVIKVPDALDSNEASSYVTKFLDNNPELITKEGLNEKLHGSGDPIESLSEFIVTASASQLATFMGGIKLGKPEYQDLVREHKEAVKEAIKRVLIIFPYMSVSKLEMAPVFVNFVAVTWQAEIHGAEDAQMAQKIYKDNVVNLYGLNDELERDATGLPDREDGEPSIVQLMYIRMLLGAIKGSGSGDVTISWIIQMNDRRIVDGMVGNGYALAPLRRLMVQASRAFPAAAFLGVGLVRGSTDRQLKAEVALRVFGIEGDEEAAKAVREMWNSNKNDLEKDTNRQLENAISRFSIGSHEKNEDNYKIKVFGAEAEYSFQDVTFTAGQDVSRYSVDGGEAVVTGTVQMRAAYRDQLFKPKTTYPRIWGMEMAVATLIAGADPDLYVKGVKINEGSDDNINVRASIVVRDTESNDAAKNAIESLLEKRPITKELINAGIVKEFDLPLGDEELVSSVGSFEVAVGPEQESLTLTVQLSGVQFTERDFNEESENYRTFKSNFEADAEATVSERCGCAPEVSITSVTFNGNAARRLQGNHDVTVTSEVNGANEEDVEGAFENSNGNLRLGGATVISVKVDVKLHSDDSNSSGGGVRREDSNDNGAGHALSCSVLLTLVLSVAVMLALN